MARRRPLTLGMYVLAPDGRTPVPCEDARVWGDFMERHSRRVALTELADRHVSTVFLGLDHQCNASGPPLLFETMVFQHEIDIDSARYATYEGGPRGTRRDGHQTWRDTHDADQS